MSTKLQSETRHLTTALVCSRRDLEIWQWKDWTCVSHPRELQDKGRGFMCLKVEVSQYPLNSHG